MRMLKVIIPCLLLNACMFGTSRNAKFYTLAATAAQPVSVSYAGWVGVERIQLPKYINRPQIVTQQKDSNQVTISEFNRWAESPAVLATRVLTENLGLLLPTAQVKEIRFRGEDADVTVMAEISNMSAVLGKQAGLSAWYTVKDASGKVQIRQKFEATVQIGKTYDDLVQGYNQLLAQLSQEIATVLPKK